MFLYNQTRKKILKLMENGRLYENVTKKGLIGTQHQKMQNGAKENHKNPIERLSKALFLIKDENGKI